MACTVFSTHAEARTSSRSWPFLTACSFVEGSTAVVELCGALDHPVAVQVATDLRALLRNRTTQLVLDVTGMTRGSHHLLAVAARAHLALKQLNGRLYVVVGDDAIFESLHHAGLNRVATVVLSRQYAERVDANVRARSSAMRVNLPRAATGGYRAFRRARTAG
jgi:anti-anti-sigma regulatory factor